jgi:phosphomannomutase
MTVSIQDLMSESKVKFGTSGARGLVADMTDRVCFAYTVGFIQYLECKGEIRPGKNNLIAVAGDLRPSTPRIMNAVMLAVQRKGYCPVNCGFIPSPAVALYGITHSIPAIMVTGSHIPADRNGIKFNKCAGEILKEDEAGIRSQIVEIDENLFDETGVFAQYQIERPVDKTAADEYKARYLNFFSSDVLRGLKIGVYQHSAVGRDLVTEIVQSLGAEVKVLDRSETFIPVDTEAIRAEDIELGKRCAREYQLDAIFSTDGDSDRPLLADENGEWLRGDVGGILCSIFLGAQELCIPVSCNTAAEKCGLFRKVRRTRIGSPYVISEMIVAEKQDSSCHVVGYEANGGFLLQTSVLKAAKKLVALPTRDALIYLLGITILSKQQGMSLSQLVAKLPQRYTYSDRLQNFSQESSKRILDLFSENLSKEALQNQVNLSFNSVGNLVSTDYTDGVRMIFDSNLIIHLRPSGNAPEFRCYTEADSIVRAKEVNQLVMRWLNNQR